MGVKRFFLDENVYEAALERVRFVYREFKHVYVSFSGGKDSTVTLNLALQVAEEMGRLPVKVLFIDQEAEWQATIDYVRQVMNDPRVSGRWLQVPFRLFNATSTSHPWLNCWEPGAQWIRPQEPDSIKRNVYGTDRFKPLFSAFLKYHHPTTPVASLGGVRCEESPGRALGLTISETYKGVTWGSIAKGEWRKHYVFFPIYDWSYRDVWKYIHDHKIPYCRLYDLMYQYGVPVMDMRVSNVHHETAVKTLFILQEIEPATWDAVTRRLHGVNAAAHLDRSWFCPTVLPSMFKDWKEYRDFLVPRLITDPAGIEYFTRTFARLDEAFSELPPNEMISLWCMEAAVVVLNDTYGTNLGYFMATHKTNNHRAKDARKQLELERVLRLQAAGLPTTPDEWGEESGAT